MIGDKVEIMVNNSFHLRMGGLLDRFDINTAHDEMEIHYHGLLRLAGHFGPVMRARGADGDHFSIQLMMTRHDNRRNLEEFLARWEAAYGDIDTLYVYETTVRGEAWFGVLYREYATLKAARDALAQLPSGVKRHKPYVRSIRNISWLG